MNWTENIQKWRTLPPERKLQLRWNAISMDVAQSMAFEMEPVSEEKIREILALITPPDSSKLLAEISVTLK
jgi:hypothetical protein